MARRRPSDINLMFAVDKPSGLTSHDVVNRARRALGERRVGHAGTLDPMATGVMVLGAGQATRLLGRLALDRKRYLARIAFGVETSTDDAEGEPVRRAPAPARLLEEDAARAALAGLLGPQEQVPPAYSAISVNGVRSYKRARAGEEVALDARPIEVFEAALVAVDEEGGAPVWTVAFEVSKGTYVRALARDLGRACGSAAHLAALRRTASGGIGLESCLCLEEVSVQTARGRALDPVAALGLAALPVDEGALARVRDGAPLDCARVSPRGAMIASGCDGLVAIVHGGALWALARREGERLRMEDVFPQGIEGVA